jgi:hypothetical protein
VLSACSSCVAQPACFNSSSSAACSSHSNIDVQRMAVHLVWLYYSVILELSSEARFVVSKSWSAAAVLAGVFLCGVPGALPCP